MDNTLNKTEMPVLAMRGVVIFPNMTLSFDVGRAKSMAALKAATAGDRLIFLVAQKDAATEDPDFDDLNKIGVVAEIKQLIKLPNSDNMRVAIEGKCRAALLSPLKTAPFLKAEVIPFFEKKIKKADELYAEALTRSLKDIFNEYAEVAPRMAPDVPLAVNEENDLSVLTDFISGNTVLGFEDKINLLISFDPIRRAELLCKMLVKETDILTLEMDIQNRVQERMDKSQRDYFLREEMKVISQELNEDDSPIAEAESFKEKIEALPIDEKSKKRLFDECNRLMKSASGSPEAAVSRSYLERVIALPWGKYSKESLDVNKARRILNKDHYGLSDVKERVLELIAVKKLSGDINSQILCLVGPPGVGKTSIARSLAKAMNREYVRISLGGVRDEAEIRGHRKTYIGSMPGRIITALEQAQTSNPLILLDEIDKLGSDYKGDPSSALLEVLDGEQNFSFCDHYIEIPFDLSKVLFVTTANDASQIPAPLFDRMDIIELYSYTADEKFNIAKKHLLPKQLKKFAMTPQNVRITDGALRAIIAGYTKEAGVRTLERCIAKLLRRCALEFAEGFDGKITVNSSDLPKYLGAVKYKPDEFNFEDMLGAANGLAWTSVGGEMMQIEVAVLEGSGKLELTGSLGDVMKESAKAAVTYIRSKAETLGIEPSFYKTRDIHIHVPEGAVPKDGPSAGVTITTALASALSERRVYSDVAMTGEITLRGKVLPIGGLREKATAAFKNGMKTVLIPKDNEPDLEKVDEVIKRSVDFIPVSTLDEVLSLALESKKTAVKVSEKKACVLNREPKNGARAVYS